MELRQYANLLLKWLWLIILGTVLAAGTAYLVSSRMAPIYRATTTLYISPASTTLLTDYTSILTSNLLAKTYGELIKKRPVMEQAITQLGLTMSPADLAGMITVTPVRDTQLLAIAVESADPALAKAIANAVPAALHQANRQLSDGTFCQLQAESFGTDDGHPGRHRHGHQCTGRGTRFGQPDCGRQTSGSYPAGDDARRLSQQLRLHSQEL